MGTDIETEDGLEILARETDWLRARIELLQIGWRHHRSTDKIRADLKTIRDIAKEMLRSIK